MYYVNREQIEQRINTLSEIVQVLSIVANEAEYTLVHSFAQERALHLAIEVITDVGSYLIDGFIMRDASSYEDIIEIMFDERVIESDMHMKLIDLVRLRKPLVQEFYDWNREAIHPLSTELPALLQQFAERVETYLNRELI